MIHPFKILISILFTTLLCLAFTNSKETMSVKCMVQMKNYTGEKSYVIVSLINPEGNYEKTLFVMGRDSEWYNEITSWWKFYGKRRTNVDAISGATVGGGERSISILKIPNEKINTGYSIRFETAVEDQEYYTKDVQFKLTSESLKTKTEGKGFIRYVRLIPQ